MYVECFECGESFAVEESDNGRCPNCGFGEEQCDHPRELRESRQQVEVDDGQYMEREYCGRCGSTV